MGTGDLRSERSVGDRWNHYATREPHGRSLFWILQDIPVWFIVSRGSSVTHKKQINVEAVNGNSLLTLEGIWFFFYQLVVCSTECVCFWKGMCCCFFVVVLNLVCYYGVVLCLSVPVAFFSWILAYTSH